MVSPKLPNEITIAASETLDELLRKVEKRDDAQEVIDIRATMKNGA